MVLKSPLFCQSPHGTVAQAQIHACMYHPRAGERAIYLRGLGQDGMIEIKRPFTLNSFQRVEDAKKQWSWLRYAGRPGREELTSERLGWDAKWYRIGGRLSCVAMSVPMTEHEWTAKHISGEFITILMFAGKYINIEHGSARFLTLKRVISAPERWERVGTLYLILPFLGKCPNNQVMLKKIPESRQDQRIIIQQ